MTDNKDILAGQLAAFGLSTLEAEVYMYLLATPSTALQLSRSLGAPRTTIYRIVDQLEKRSLVARHTDDQGTLLVATEPGILEVELTHREEQLRVQRETLQRLLPALNSLGTPDAQAFAVRTYEGERGFRQMLWHELKTEGELLVMGAGTTEQIMPSAYWTKKHRELSVEAGYRLRVLINDGPDDKLPSLENKAFSKLYSGRTIAKSVLPLTSQVSIYNNTVSIYHWRADKKIGTEIISPTYAATMRAIFEPFWAMAAPATS